MTRNLESSSVCLTWKLELLVGQQLFKIELSLSHRSLSQCLCLSWLECRNLNPKQTYHFTSLYYYIIENKGNWIKFINFYTENAQVEHYGAKIITHLQMRNPWPSLYCLLTNLLLRAYIILPEPIFVNAQVTSHYFPSGVPHTIYEIAPCRTQCSDEKVGLCCHQEINKGIVCTGLPAQTCLICGHCHVPNLSCYIRVVEIPFRVLLWLVDNFLKIYN